MKFSALIKDLYRNLRTFQWLPLKIKDFSSYKDISPLFLDSEEGNERTRELATKPRAKPLTLASPFASLSRVACPNVGDWIWKESESLNFTWTVLPLPPQTLCFGDKAPRTMRRKGREAKRCLASFLLPSILCKNIFIERERDLWVRSSEQCLKNISLGVIFLFITSIMWRVMHVHNFNSQRSHNWQTILLNDQWSSFLWEDEHVSLSLRTVSFLCSL